MLKELQPILLSDFEIAVPGFQLRRLALSQHMPRVEKLSEHVHDWFQALLYLRGHGVQHLGTRRVPVERGSWLIIPPGCRHRFVKERTIRPVCLAIDFETEDSGLGGGPEGVLTSLQLARVEKFLVLLNAEEKSARPGRLAISSLVLQIAGILETASTESGPTRRGPVEHSVEAAILGLPLDRLRPGLVAEKVGCSLDHLNRQLRSECGKTVGGAILSVRLERATRLLQNTDRSIGEIAAEVGMMDQNYFGRWFRKATGQTPTRWREAMWAER